MSSAGQENNQWLSVTEETLFLHDGLIRVTDLVELPRDVNTQDTENEVISFDLKNPSELSDRLLAVCGTHNNAYSKLLEYRLNALRGLWNAQKQLATEENTERENSNTEETIALLKKQGLWKESEQASFSTRISVLLVLPLLQSQSRIDPNLCGVTSVVLLGCLRECAPLSLSKEPGDCLKGLENLLCSWLGEKLDPSSSLVVENKSQRRTVASTLVALACARGHLKTFVHTVHLLLDLSDIDTLPVADILDKLLETEGGQGHVPAILGNKHMLCWGFEDLLSGTEKESGEKDKADGDISRSLTCDGVYLYTTNACGRGLAKVGSGLNGSLRGYVYARNPEIGPGKIAYGGGVLFYRPLTFDQEADVANLCLVLDRFTLKPIKTIPKPETCVEAGPCTTIAFCTDGSLLYWVWCPILITDKTTKGVHVYVDTLKYEQSDSAMISVKPRVTLIKKDDSGAKTLNESLMSRLRPAYRGSASTLAALTGLENGAAKKEDSTQQTGSTTCGVVLKTLVKTPIFIDGSHVVMVTSLTGANIASGARSLFGSSGSLSGLRSLAANLCFSLSDGLFVQRPDLVDAPSCAMARGAPIASLGTCFDVENNVIWTCSNDLIDQYYNPGHQAPHHIRARLCIETSTRQHTSDELDVPLHHVVHQLLQHVGSMCLHQINSDLMYTPFGSYTIQQYPVDYTNLDRICDILNNSITIGHTQTIVCALIVLQLIFKMSVFKDDKPEGLTLIQKTRSLVWRLVVLHEGTEMQIALAPVQMEACRVITYGLLVMYPTHHDRTELMRQLLENSDHPGLLCLRDKLLVDFADQLKGKTTKLEQSQHLRFTDDIIHLLLKIAVKESCTLLNNAVAVDNKEFEKQLSEIPCASPCLRYLMSLQCYYLQEGVLLTIPEANNTDVTPTSVATDKLKELQTIIQQFAERVFMGSCKVLEVLLECCNKLINNNKDDLETRLQGLEKVAKATILGHLLPPLMTSMTHENLRCLSMADLLMPQLVQLVVLSSQAALLLKSQVQVIMQDDLSTDSDSDVIDFIGQVVENADLKEQEEQGFLAGLKIPAPWASGKSLESIHPVRDNYKFKETVHIPGARCLYLRFDPRSSSQYDYDKMVVHAGANTTCKKVAEYGGNTYGFGSRSVLGSGWPKDLVKVDGDTVTFAFEMRSGREHNTPDKAMWGFIITVRAQESPEEVSSGLPFLADLGLGLSVLACTMLHLLYQGPEKTKDEIACQHLLKSKLLQRCVWQSGSFSTTPDSPKMSPRSQVNPQCMSPKSPKIPRIKLPSEILKNLLSLAPRHPPHLRPSIREALKPDTIQERVVSAVVKHLGLEDTVRYFTPSKEGKTDEFMLLRSVMEEICRRIDALIRQLQSLADLEQRWHTEVMERQGDKSLDTPPFFHDFHLQEGKLKELSMLCFVKDVVLDTSKLEDATKDLSDKFENEVQTKDVEVESESHKNATPDKGLPKSPAPEKGLPESPTPEKGLPKSPAPEKGLPKSPAPEKGLPKTRQLVEGILTRLDLLLHVNIAAADGSSMTRTVSQCIEAIKSGENVMARSDTDVLQGSNIMRSISAPGGVDTFQDDTVLDLMKLHRRRPKQKYGPMSVLQDLLEDQEERSQPPHVTLIGQLFSFIGSDPEKAISSELFLKTAYLRWWRGNTRKQALVHMKELLSAASRVGGATHLVAAVTSVLRHGPRVEELTCGGMVNHVREAFAETMTSVVQVAARYPIACCNSIGLLCIVPYTRAEEKCLVRSGLVHLLDKLCSLANHRSEKRESQSTRQKVSAMAWAGFQVLANRCVMWETEEGSQYEDLEHSGLARQVSVLLTNHLARATESSGNEAAGTEALQEVLSLLNNLSRSHMGKAILSQPACVSKLLSLLLDQRPSPKLVLIILQLCRVALPLMDAMDCEQVELPNWGVGINSSYWNTSKPISDPPAKIVSLLLARLGDFLVPGDLATVASRQQSMESEVNKGSMDQEGGDEGVIQNGRLSVYIHKRDDQFSHEVIQPLLSSENRPFRLGAGANMDKVVRLDREMTKNGKAEIVTEDALSALRKAAKWAQMGLVVSTGPPIDSSKTETPSGDKKKTEKDITCRDKNSELARTDPVRPFISGHVANSMAAEVIELLHCLLNTPDCNTGSGKSWSEAVQRVLVNALTGLPVLLNSLESLSSPRCHSHQLMSMARQVNAALCALGGFKEGIKPGCNVEVLGDVQNSTGNVVIVSQQTGMVTIRLDPDPPGTYSPRYCDTIHVPYSRVQPSRNRMFSSQQLSMTDAVVTAMQAILLPHDDNSSHLQQCLPMSDDGNSLTNQISRVVAELESRACMVLALYLKEISFAKEFIQHCGSTIDMLKSLAKDCSTGVRKQVVESHCDRLRTLYRDCAKPPPPPSKVDNRNKEMMWDTGRNFPAVRACLFSHSVTGVTFLGDPSAGTGLPRGTMVYSNIPIPFQAPSFYWELEVCSFGDGQDESSAFVSFGFAPPAEKKDGAWTNPIGTCLFLNNGKAVHYNGASLLQWRSVRLDCTVGAGDIAGIGWERTGDPPMQGETPRGRVYFTFNGRRLQPWIDDVAGAMFPVVHIQKKATRVKANFGSRSFAYAEGQQHREAADEADDMTREIRESFSHLPFNSPSDSDSEEIMTAPSTPSNTTDMSDLSMPAGPACKTVPLPKPLKEYNPESSKFYKLFHSYDNMITTGPDPRSSIPTSDTMSDESSAEEEQTNEDHYALLVKAWEQKVFPVIRRRFRNEAERKDGLEQIKGALQLGMTDIARQTVEFLYEENGGMPRDLHLPTIEDIKEDLAKFTIDRVRKGTTVMIRDPTGSSACGTTVLPKFAVRSMLKTFGLTGTVLDVNNPNELVQVETYLRSEGVLVRYWYPLNMLERPPAGLRKSTITGGQILDTCNTNIHRELIRTERILARMYCRTALLRLIDHCNSSAMEAFSCSASLASGMAASAALLQELDIENIQLLSNELLRAPQPHGTITAKSLSLSDSSQHCLAAQSCSLSNLIYDNVDRLKEELAIAIARAAGQGEDYLTELTNQICSCLQTAPEMFPYEEFPVTESKTNTDIYFPGAACLVVSCKTDPKSTKKETSLYKSPWARIFCYTGQRIKKTGQVSKQEVVSYPRDTTSTSNHDEQYTPAIIPCDRIHIRVGVSPPPGVIVTIHALPPQFLLALTYIETLITERHGCGTKSCTPPKQDDNNPWDMPRGSLATPSPSAQTTTAPPTQERVCLVEKDGKDSLWNLDNIVITPPVYSHMIEQICVYLWKTDIPALVKEYMFHQLAQSIRIYHYSEGGNGSRLPSPHPHLNTNHGLLVQLHSELKVLYDTETQGWETKTTPSGTGIGIGATDQGRFSTYFHALMEVNLAVAELNKPTSRSRGTDSGQSLELTHRPPTSPTHTSRRKKMKAKREKRDSVSQRKVEERRTSESEGDLSQQAAASSSSSSLMSLVASVSDHLMPGVTPSTSGASSSATSQDSKDKDKETKESKSLKSLKQEDDLWLHRALTVSHILRCLAFNEKNGIISLVNAIADAHQVLSAVTAHQRLVIITGIPTNLDPDFVKQALWSVFKAHGGVDRDEIFLPYEVKDVPVMVMEGGTELKDEATGETVGTVSGADNREKTPVPEQELTGENVGTGAGLTTGNVNVENVDNVGNANAQTDDQKEVNKGGDERNKKKGGDSKKDGKKEDKSEDRFVKQKRLNGYAVVSVLSKTKVDNIKKGLLKSQALFEGTSVDQDDPIEMPTVSTVGPNLIGEDSANDALEKYLQFRFFQDKNQVEISDNATLALTEIFHSCFIVEQRHGTQEFRHESGYICLSKDQILQHTPENLLYTFFSNIRAPKKSLTEQVTQVLRRYGILQSPDKESSPGTERHGKGKGKKLQKSSKEKVLMSTDKTTQKEKKSKDKLGAEKSEKEDDSLDPSEKMAKAGTQEKEDHHCLTLDGFLQYVADMVIQDVRAVWRAILASGFDIHFERCCCLDNSQAQQMARQWTLDLDTTLTHFVNSYCRKLAVTPARLHPHEIHISQAELTSERYACLQGVPLESIRLRFAFLQSLNNTLETFFLPLIDLRPRETYSRSTAALLSQVRGLIFYDTKCSLVNRILNSTAQRKPDQAAPEITLDPLEDLGSERETSICTTFCQAYRQLSQIPSSQLCVRLAQGGDPTYSFNVKFTGEEVHGTSGSFRHFLWQIARELEDPLLNLLVPCNNANYKGKCLLKPGTITIAEERLIIFLGQLLGTTIRADIPIGLDLTASFWKSLVGLDLDTVTDIKEVDPLTYSYIKKIEMVDSEAELLALCTDVYPRFVYPSLSGEEMELVPHGRHILVSWENRHQYVNAIRQLRSREMVNRSRMEALRSGLATILPLQLLTIMSPLDIELRTCGMPYVDIEFLKAHTMYQVGLMETDKHIQYFWTTLEGLSQEDLCRFIKFACNQERIPQSCPCRDGGSDTAHVPPYPMKIAPPPDGQTGSPDDRYIRVETCMFMIKLPQYSSQEVMTQRLTYAIHCREDPLSG